LIGLRFVFIDQDYRLNVSDGEGLVAPLKSLGDVEFYDDRPCSQDVLYERGRGADVIFVKINQFTNELLDRLADSGVKFFQFMGIGYSNYLDVDHCLSSGMKIRGIGEYGSNSVAEYALASILCATRGIAAADRRMKAKVWDMNGLLGVELASSTVGVVGTGAIGELVARKLSLLGAKVLAADIAPKRELVEKYGVKYADIETLMRESDVVTLHLKYTPETHGLVSGELLGLMKPGAFLINIARAQIVDYDALKRLLDEGRIRGAAIDVHYGEPPADWSLALMDSVTASPHMGYFTEASNTNMLRLSVESVLDFVKSGA
jgi:phosphoglycerate dehydrogenase-like enzyme